MTKIGMTFSAVYHPVSTAPCGPRLCTWNARSLFPRRTESRKRKLKFLLSELLPSADLVCVQEVRGDDVLNAVALRHLERSWHVFLDHHPTRRKGGLLTLARKSAFPSAEPTYSSCAVGRIGHLALSSPSACWVVWNVHNYGLAMQEFVTFVLWFGMITGLSENG